MKNTALMPMLNPKNGTYAGIFLLHACPVIALFFGTTTIDWIVFACMWPVLAISSTLGLHRYFAHKSFKTSRGFQGFLAICATISFGDPIGFSGKHRIHHKYSDQGKDVHSPRHGLWRCWIGNLVDCGHSETEVRRHAKDLCRFPELVWLHENRRVPGLLVSILFFTIGGFSMLAIGYALAVVSIIHLAGAVNYFCHGRGSRRYETNDESTNNWFIAIFSLGEGWHNNHHYCQNSARAGFYWYEIDILYWIICLLERMGLVWNVRRPPERAYKIDLSTKRLGDQY